MRIYFKIYWIVERWKGIWSCYC